MIFWSSSCIIVIYFTVHSCLCEWVMSIFQSLPAMLIINDYGSLLFKIKFCVAACEQLVQCCYSHGFISRLLISSPLFHRTTHTTKPVYLLTGLLWNCWYGKIKYTLPIMCLVLCSMLLHDSARSRRCMTFWSDGKWSSAEYSMIRCT